MESEYMKELEQLVEFLKNISVANDDDRNILSEAREKVNDVHRNLPGKISSNSDIAYFIFQDSKSAVIKELNDVCDKLSDLSIKADIQNYVASLPQDDDGYTSGEDAVDVDDDDDDFDDVDDDDDDDDGEISDDLKKKYILTLEIRHYDQTLEFMEKLATTAEKEQAVEYEHEYSLLISGYYAIKNIRDNVDVSSSEDLSLMISKSRSQVEYHLSAICNNLSDLTYNQDLSQHLSGFKEACLRLPKLPSEILDSSFDYTEWKRMSRLSEITPIDIPENHEVDDELADIDYCYRNPNKCMEEEDEKYFPRVIRIGNWDPKYKGHGISLLDPSAMNDYSEDEIDDTDTGEGSPNFRLLDELLASTSHGSRKFHWGDKPDSTNMSEISPKVHSEDELMIEESSKDFRSLFGNWDPKYKGQGIRRLDPSAMSDYSEVF